MKFLASSGFGYMFPEWAGLALNGLIGERPFTDTQMVAMGINNWRYLPGGRAMVVLPHISKVFGPLQRTVKLILLTVVAGALTSILYTIWLCYTNGAANFATWSLIGAQVHDTNELVSRLATTERMSADPQKAAVWLLGAAFVAGVAVLTTRFPWFTFHPLGVIMGTGHLQHIFLWLYVLDVFLVWLAKVLILKYGGITLYRRLRPLFYGLIVGFVAAAGVSFAVDIIWFPEAGHEIHYY
jgi:hypothetical protein